MPRMRRVSRNKNNDVILQVKTGHASYEACG